MTMDYEKKLELAKQFFDLYPEYREPNDFSDQDMTDDLLDVYQYLPAEFKESVDYFLQTENRDEAQNLYSEYLKFAKKNESKDEYIDMLHTGLASTNEDGRINGEKYKFQAIRDYRNFIKNTEMTDKNEFLKKFEPLIEAYSKGEKTEQYQKKYSNSYQEQKKKGEELSRKFWDLRREISGESSWFTNQPIGREYSQIDRSESNLHLKHKGRGRSIAKGYRYDTLHYPFSTLLHAHHQEIYNGQLEKRYDLCVALVEAAEKCATAGNKLHSQKLSKGEFQKIIKEFDTLYDAGRIDEIIDRNNELHEEASIRKGMSKSEIMKIRTFERLGMKKDSVLIPQEFRQNSAVSEPNQDSSNMRG